MRISDWSSDVYSSDLYSDCRPPDSRARESGGPVLIAPLGLALSTDGSDDGNAEYTNSPEGIRSPSAGSGHGGNRRYRQAHRCAYPGADSSADTDRDVHRQSLAEIGRACCR